MVPRSLAIASLFPTLCDVFCVKLGPRGAFTFRFRMSHATIW
jgi:hypothetical protein